LHALAINPNIGHFLTDDFATKIEGLMLLIRIISNHEIWLAINKTFLSRTSLKFFMLTLTEIIFNRLEHQNLITLFRYFIFIIGKKIIHINPNKI